MVDRAEPAESDIAVFHRMTDSLALIDIVVRDYVIVGESITPVAERGLAAAAPQAA